MSLTALIADDEPLVADALERELARAWPALRIVAQAANGIDALASIAELHPSIAFLDIAMPGATGLEVARACAQMARAPHIVFVTAYDQYAVDAFEHAALDYLLKPVDVARLAQTVARLKARVDAADRADLAPLLAELQRLATAPRAPAPLRFLRALHGGEVRFVPLDDVLVLEAADKYVVVTTREAELLIRTSLKDLLAQLDPQRFWQAHRSTVVNVDHVESASTSALGKTVLKLRGRPGTVPVSRQYAHRFRQM